jgi:predicted amidohydrolase YtcJ
LHEGDYPPPEAVMDMARRADAAGLRLAVHCVTVADLVFTLSLLLECGLAHRARIEHASLVPPDMIQALAQSRVTVVTQPHFIAERGDDYRRDIPAQEHDDLYRCATLRQAGVRVAFGTDAPFGHFDPWASMHAAVRRRTPSGAVLGAADSVSPEQALAMYTTPLTDPGGTPRTLAVGQVADLCLLTQPWRVARQDLGSVSIKATFCRGNLVHGAGAQEMGRKVA